MLKKISILFIASLMCVALWAQNNPVKWDYSVNKISEDEVELVFKANVAKPFHLYSQFLEDGGPIPTEFTYDQTKNFKLIGKASEKPAPIEAFDETYEVNVRTFEKDAEFRQKIKVLSEEDFVVSGVINYMVCDENSCFPINDLEFKFQVKGVPSAMAATTIEDTITPLEDTVAQATQEGTTIVSSTQDSSSEGEEESLLGFFILALLAGFAAVLTPCVFPMIPMTVSFFMSGESNRSAGIIKGIIFTGSITLIYTAIGGVVAITKSADFANVISTHWIPNLIFFLLFVAFAFSFFGLFEITLPSGLSNKLDAKADKGGYISAFFMAAVLTIVSFSCTGPFVATLLVEAAMGTSVLKPLLGMALFGFAMGSPFFLLSLSPSLISKLPKSGGWLNSIKVVFAFILLAFGLKFILTIDQVQQLNIITREVYLGVWIVIFTLMGLYLMGKIKFSHDSELKYIGVSRLVFIIITFSFVLYLIPGLFGAPLKAISAFIPPQTSQQFDLTKNQSVGGASQSTTPKGIICGEPRYADKLHLPYGLVGYFDYEEGLKCAKEQNKPIFLDFKGHSCANCKDFEAKVWEDSRVQELLSQYVIIALYGDEKTELPESEWVTASNGRIIKTLGKKNSNFQIERFKSNALPYYIMLDTEGENLVPKAYDNEVNVEKFIKFLEEGLANFKN